MQNWGGGGGGVNKVFYGWCESSEYYFELGIRFKAPLTANRKSDTFPKTVA